MSNDAKLGLVLGVALVLVIALVFFRTDAQAARTSPAQPVTATKTAEPIHPRVTIDAPRP